MSHPLLALPRNAWRQLTSMRTALILLFLLAVGAVPGSVLPQRGVNIEKVDAWYDAHPKLAPALERLGFFEVFGSVWFSAIYLLLFTSLVGCILPRLRDQLRALRAAPPAAPKRLDRLPRHTTWRADGRADGDVPGELTRIAGELRRRRWRVSVGPDAVSAEKGHLKETGNLLFHLALLVVLVGVALGSWYGWHGNRILVAGADTAFCNTTTQYDESKLGPRVGDTDLPRFCLELTDFRARFLETGQPEFYRATVDVEQDDSGPRRRSFSVNSPLRLDGANVYLLGHGYAPVIRYTDRNGKSQTSVAPFLTNDGNLTSEGVAAFPDVNLDPRTGARNPDLQIAFEGIYLPTAPDSPPFVRSTFPAERSPGLVLLPYRGNLGLDAGIPGSVYKLDQRQISSGKLKQVAAARMLRPGEKWTLDDGTTVEFLGTRPYITLSVRYDPGELIVLASGAVLLVGLMLSLTGRRRRVWFRVTGDAPDADGTPAGSTVVSAGGLPRTDYPGFADEFDQLVEAVRGTPAGDPVATGTPVAAGQDDAVREGRERTD